jgi:hypothetical protein
VRGVAQNSASQSKFTTTQETPPEIPSHRGATCAAKAATGAASPTRDHVCTVRSSLTHRQDSPHPPYPGCTRPGPGSSESGREDNEARAAMRIMNIGQECQSVVLISGLTCGNQQQQPSHPGGAPSDTETVYPRCLIRAATREGKSTRRRGLLGGVPALPGCVTRDRFGSEGD